MIDAFQDKLKPGESSPTEGKWCFELSADGHIYHTSRFAYDTRDAATAAAFSHSPQLAKRA